MNISFRFAFRILSYLFSAYSTLVVIRVLLTWVLRGKSAYEHKVTAFIAKATDWYLNMFRSVKALQTQRIDFSPILALIPLNILQSVFNILANYGTITVPVIIAIIVQSLWNYLFKFIFKFWLILMGIRLAGAYISPQNSANIFGFIDPMINTPVCWVWHLFYRKQQPEDKKLVLTSFIFYLVLYFAMSKGLSFLINILLTT